jgi:hypothetical protein
MKVTIVGLLVTKRSDGKEIAPGYFSRWRNIPVAQVIDEGVYIPSSIC